MTRDLIVQRATLRAAIEKLQHMSDHEESPHGIRPATRFGDETKDMAWRRGIDAAVELLIRMNDAIGPQE